MTTFVVADLHFGDEVVSARRFAFAGLPLRPFASAADMDAEIIRRWNQSVTEHDLVYVLGDVGRGQNVRSMSRLAGRKHLIAGNRDDIAAIASLGLFESIGVAKRLPGVLLTHIPVHPAELGSEMINIHGHLHARTIKDQRYVCVSLEQTGLGPVRLSEATMGRCQRRLPL